jgi:hypothetical protein
MELALPRLAADGRLIAALTVGLQRNRSAAIAELILGTPIRCSAICTWKRRTSSLVALSGDRPKKAAKLLTWRT